jgi:endonuclease YncB( thermonuclease family)
MSGSIWASPAHRGLTERRKIAAPAPARLDANSKRKDALDTVLHLSFITIVGAVTICVFFGAAFCFLRHPTSTRSTPVDTGASRSPPFGRIGQPAQLVQLAAIAADFFSGPELGREPPRQNPAPKRLGIASAPIVSGPVSEVIDAMTWVVGGQVIRLWGVRPGPPLSLASLAARVNASGPINCRRQTHSPRYRCLTEGGEDIGEIALSLGIGRTVAGVPAAYRHTEAQARAAGIGLWARR